MSDSDDGQGGRMRSGDQQAFARHWPRHYPFHPLADALRSTPLARAFASLPEVAQAVLWYSEIEGLDPHEVAPRLGMTPNAAADLAYRAGRALRSGWLRAHASAALAVPDCAWAIARVGDQARVELVARDHSRFRAHLASCTRCTLIAAEADEIGSRLALVLLPLLPGTPAGSTQGTVPGRVGTTGAPAPVVPFPPVPRATEVGGGSPAGGARAAVGAPVVASRAAALAVRG